MKKYIFLTFILLCFFPVYLMAGWIVTGRYVDSEGKTTMRRYFIEGNQIKFEQYNLIYSFNLETGRLILVNPDQLIYVKTTIDEYQNKLLSQSQLRLNISLAEIPSDLRPAYETAYRKQAHEKIFLTPFNNDSVQISPLNDTAKLLGINTQKYLVKVAGRKKEEFYFSNEKDCFAGIDMKKLYALQYLLFPDDLSVLYQATSPYENLTHGGLVIRRFIFFDGYKNEWQVSKFEEKEIPAYEFGVPSLCKELTLDKWLSQSVANDSNYDDYE